MVCSNCGNNLRENEKFCTVCGTYNDPLNSIEEENLDSKKEKKKKEKIIPPKEKESFLDIKEEKPIKKEKQSFVVEEYVPNEDPDIVAYIGEDYKWIAERPFNIYALLLSWMYFLYRKLYLIGIIGLIVTGIIYKFVSIILIPYIVISMVGCGLAFNKIYLDIVDKRVAKIKNNAKALDDVEAICRKKGGVNVVIPLIIFFIFLAIMLLSYFNIGFSGKEPKFWEETSNNSANCKSICRDIYTKNENSGSKIEEMGCEVVTNTQGEKVYNIYIKYNKNGSTRITMFQNDPTGYMIQKGDTDQIARLEQYESTLSENDREFLKISKNLSNKLSSMKADSDNEDKEIKRYTNTSGKKHFYYKEDDLFK